MEQTNAFISALEEWNEKVKPIVNDYETLLFFISYALGGNMRHEVAFSNERSELIKERISELISNEKMQEDFLITSLIKLVDEYLENQITGLGDSISLHLKTREKEEIRELSEKMLEKFTRPGYVLNAQRELECWRIIAIEKLGASNRRIWENNRFLDRVK